MDIILGANIGFVTIALHAQYNKNRNGNGHRSNATPVAQKLTKYNGNHIGREHMRNTTRIAMGTDIAQMRPLSQKRSKVLRMQPLSRKRNAIA